MKWVRFEKSDQLRDFMEAIRSLHLPLLEQLSEFEQNLFYHYWFNKLNYSETHILVHRSRTQAVVSYPSCKPIHWMRWPYNTMAIREGFHDTLELPRQIGSAEYFYVPFGSDPSHIHVHDSRSRVIQAAYARNLQESVPHPPAPGYTFSEVHEKDLEEVKSLFARENRSPGADPTFFDTYYVPELMSDLDRNEKWKIGHAYCARSEDTGQVVAAVYYTAYEMQLTGTPCTLIYDIVVHPEHRRRGVAAAMQAFAYDRMLEKGIRWVLGNVEVDNAPSLGQVRKLGRRLWSYCLEVKPIAVHTFDKVDR